MSENKLVFVVDISCSKMFVGELVELTHSRISINNPIIIKEVITQSHNQQAQLNVSVTPIFNAFDQKNIIMKWSSYGEITDTKLISTYYDFCTRQNAARAGLDLVREMPKNLPLIQKS